MFIIGLIYGTKTIKTAWNVNDKLFSLKVGPLFILFLCNAGEWIFLIFSLTVEDGLPILHYVTFSTAADNLFSMCFSK